MVRLEDSCRVSYRTKDEHASGRLQAISSRNSHCTGLSLMGTERQVPVARKLEALREQGGECLTCSIGIAPNVVLGKVRADLQNPDALVAITKDDFPRPLPTPH